MIKFGDVASITRKNANVTPDRTSLLAGLFRSSSASKDRRRLPRIPEVHATAIIDEASYPLCDWNPKGFMVDSFNGRYAVGQSLQVSLVIPAGGRTFNFRAKAKVVRHEKAKKELAAVFTDLEKKTARRLTQLAAAKL